MSGALHHLSTVLNSPELLQKVHLDSLLQALGAARNGWVYGSRLRFAHSVTLLLVSAKVSSFAQLRARLWKAAQNSQKHGLSLTAFAFLYKTILTGLKHLRARSHNSKGSSSGGTPAKATAFELFASGFVSGYVIYGNRVPYFSNPISQQMTLYIFSRVLLGLSRLLGDEIALRLVAKLRGVSNSQLLSSAHTIAELKRSAVYNRVNAQIKDTTWSVVAAFTWGIIMVLWRDHRGVLNHSMNSSMDYIYGTYSWRNLKEFFTNKGVRRAP